MPWFVNVGTLVVIFVLLEGMLVHALAEDQEVVMATTENPCYPGLDRVECYNCKTSSDSDDDFCGDPFNSTHPDVTKVTCGKAEYCTKWVVRLKSGAVQTTRTCSDKLELNLKMYTVCMSESGSDTGHLCFCEGTLCNAATSLAAVTSLWTYVIVCVLVSVQVARNFDCHRLAGQT